MENQPKPSARIIRFLSSDDLTLNSPRQNRSIWGSFSSSAHSLIGSPRQQKTVSFSWLPTYSIELQHKFYGRSPFGEPITNLLTLQKDHPDSARVEFEYKIDNSSFPLADAQDAQAWMTELLHQGDTFPVLKTLIEELSHYMHSDHGLASQGMGFAYESLKLKEKILLSTAGSQRQKCTLQLNDEKIQVSDEKEFLKCNFYPPTEGGDPILLGPNSGKNSLVKTTYSYSYVKREAALHEDYDLRRQIFNSALNFEVNSEPNSESKLVDIDGMEGFSHVALASAIITQVIKEELTFPPLLDENDFSAFQGVACWDILHVQQEEILEESNGSVNSGESKDGAAPREGRLVFEASAVTLSPEYSQHALMTQGEIYASLFNELAFLNYIASHLNVMPSSTIWNENNRKGLCISLLRYLENPFSFSLPAYDEKYLNIVKAVMSNNAAFDEAKLKLATEYLIQGFQQQYTLVKAHYQNLEKHSPEMVWENIKKLIIETGIISQLKLIGRHTKNTALGSFVDRCNNYLAPRGSSASFKSLMKKGLKNKDFALYHEVLGQLKKITKSCTEPYRENFTEVVDLTLEGKEAPHPFLQYFSGKITPLLESVESYACLLEELNACYVLKDYCAGISSNTKNQAIEILHAAIKGLHNLREKRDAKALLALREKVGEELKSILSPEDILHLCAHPALKSSYSQIINWYRTALFSDVTTSTDEAYYLFSTTDNFYIAFDKSNETRLDKISSHSAGGMGSDPYARALILHHFYVGLSGYYLRDKPDTARSFFYSRLAKDWVTQVLNQKRVNAVASDIMCAIPLDSAASPDPYIRERISTLQRNSASKKTKPDDVFDITGEDAKAIVIESVEDAIAKISCFVNKSLDALTTPEVYIRALATSLQEVALAEGMGVKHAKAFDLLEPKDKALIRVCAWMAALVNRYGVSEIKSSGAVQYKYIFSQENINYIYGEIRAAITELKLEDMTNLWSDYEALEQQGQRAVLEYETKSEEGAVGLELAQLKIAGETLLLSKVRERDSKPRPEITDIYLSLKITRWMHIFWNFFNATKSIISRGYLCVSKLLPEDPMPAKIESGNIFICLSQDEKSLWVYWSDPNSGNICEQSFSVNKMSLNIKRFLSGDNKVSMDRSLIREVESLCVLSKRLSIRKSSEQVGAESTTTSLELIQIYMAEALVTFVSFALNASGLCRLHALEVLTYLKDVVGSGATVANELLNNIERHLLEAPDESSGPIVRAIFFSELENDIFLENDFHFTIKTRLSPLDDEPSALSVGNLLVALQSGLTRTLELAKNQHHLVSIPYLMEPLLTSFIIIYNHLPCSKNLDATDQQLWEACIATVTEIGANLPNGHLYDRFSKEWGGIMGRALAQDPYDLVLAYVVYANLNVKPAMNIIENQWIKLTGYELNLSVAQALCIILEPKVGLEKNLAMLFTQDVWKVLWLGNVLCVHVSNNYFHERSRHLFSKTLDRDVDDLQKIYETRLQDWKNNKALPMPFDYPVVFIYQSSQRILRANERPITKCIEIYENNGVITRNDCLASDSYLFNRAAAFLGGSQKCDLEKILHEKAVLNIGTRIASEFFVIVLQLLHEAMRFMKMSGSSSVHSIPLSYALISDSAVHDDAKELSHSSEEEIVGLFYLGLIYELLAQQKSEENFSVAMRMLNIPRFFAVRKNVGKLGAEGIESSGILNFGCPGPSDPVDIALRALDKKFPPKNTSAVYCKLFGKHRSSCEREGAGWAERNSSLSSLESAVAIIPGAF